MEEDLVKMVSLVREVETGSLQGGWVGECRLGFLVLMVVEWAWYVKVLGDRGRVKHGGSVGRKALIGKGG